MKPPRKIADVLDTIRPESDLPELDAPTYLPLWDGPKVMLAVQNMKRHMSDEGWQLAQSLEFSGYKLAGRGLEHNETNTLDILRRYDPSVVVVQDKREWHLSGPRDFRDPTAYFHHTDALKARPNIFRVTVLKDSHQRPAYHREAAQEIGCHAWITYYHPRIVKRLATYIRERHLIRTYHSLEPSLVPEYTSKRRHGAILSGAISAKVYPLRYRLRAQAPLLPDFDYLAHPGYHNHGCATPEYLRHLSRFKVAVCTSSIYGYALRKLIEATACGCIVVTDLPTDDILPYIDGNLVRVHPDIEAREMAELLNRLYADYNGARQHGFARLAKSYYDWRQVGLRLALAIEQLR